MRRLLPLLLVVLSVLACAPAAGAAVPIMALEDPITDNYKASYNANPAKPELRTWLALVRVQANGTTWAPIVPDQIVVTPAGAVDVQGADGRRGRLTARVTGGALSASVIFRVDPANVASRGRWGVLATVSDRAALASSPGAVALSLTIDGTEFAVGSVTYQHDPAIAGVAPGHIEYNGPGGRWSVGGTATRTQEEPTPAVGPVLVAGAPAATVARPRIIAIRTAVRTSSRVVPLRVTGRAGVGTSPIRTIRVRIDSGAWGRWVAVRPSYSLVLPRGSATRTVRIQLRDSRGVTSLIAARRIACACG